MRTAFVSSVATFMLVFGLLSVTGAAPAAEQMDQSNAPEWAGGWTNVNPVGEGQAAMWQTFMPSRSNLTAVEIDILTISPGRGDDVLTVEIARDGAVVASTERLVKEGLDGFMRFEFPEAVPLVPEQTYELKVRDTGKGQFGWKYGSDTYDRGSRHVFAQPRLGTDWFFRTYARVESPVAKYGGGTGEPDDPYRIATAADLIALGETPADYDKHFILTADIDLDPNLPDCKVFDNAVIAGAWKPPFTGVFDGDGHTISHLTIVGGFFSLGLFGQLGWNFQGQSSGEPACTVTNLAVEDVSIVGSGSSAGALAAYVEWAVVSHSRSTGKVSGKDAVGGLVGYNQYTVVNCHSACTVTGSSDVGGLVGENNGSLANCHSSGAVNGGQAVGGLAGRHRGSITQSCSTGAVSGKDAVGGLVGCNGIYSMLHRVFQPGDIDRSYSTGAVKGETCVGGLIGEDSYGSIRHCYSTGAVSGSAQVGGLVSEPAPATDVTAIVDVTASFWDVEASGLTVSGAGQGKTTVQMRTARMFLDAGWDFVGETLNGTEDVWWIFDGRDYPRLWWERVLGDDLEDGKAGPLWFVYEPEPELARIREVNGRLEASTVGAMENVDAMYVAEGWRLDATKDFAIRVDFHFSKQGQGDGRVTLGIGPSLDPEARQWAEFEAGCFDSGPFYLYEVSDGFWVREVVADRSAEEGTLFMSYNPDADELYFSHSGYGKANAWQTVSGLLRGRWSGAPVYVLLGIGSEGMVLTGADAWLDDFAVNAGTLVTVEPDGQSLLSGLSGGTAVPWRTACRP